ncbi:Hydantoin utilization protein C [Pseudobythopirellula maris]|uniref:Hydantoin utilization protein C n=1 Tax=Pseudobythopirellula maris TaxID=2527991 RepID=A0A5C5ZLE9_9BACT|nr:allantoate amidohydrolase [Pseudobythopirellula maris]TWT87641.1 Hydantoin utilization protein C [Pseudobythopirellula maris]
MPGARFATPVFSAPAARSPNLPRQDSPSSDPSRPAWRRQGARPSARHVGAPALESADAVMSRCDELALCTEEPDRITRRFLTEPMQAVHERVASWMRAAGLETRIDNAGNIVGRRVSPGATRALVIGSHLDSVPNAGRYDGVLGVLMGVAAAEVLGETPLPFHLDVIGFSEEEGVRYSKPYLGSSAVAGLFQNDWLGRKDERGVTMRDAIASFGLNPNQITKASYADGEVLGFIEPHLEQGPVLERADSPVGVVSGIAGQSRLRVEFVGAAGHAGTTPMHGRSDALVAASHFVAAVQRIGLDRKGMRATVGRFDVTPNASNVIAERVELSLDVRHVEDGPRELAIADMLTDAARIAAAERVGFAVLENTSQSAVAVDAGLTETLCSAIAECGQEPLRMASGAGHDAVVMAQRFPMAMLFLRHPGAVSHHPDERVERDDVAIGVEVLSRAITRLAEQSKSDA